MSRGEVWKECASWHMTRPYNVQDIRCTHTHTHTHTFRHASKFRPVALCVCVCVCVCEDVSLKLCRSFCGPMQRTYVCVCVCWYACVRVRERACLLLHWQPLTHDKLLRFHCLAARKVEDSSWHRCLTLRIHVSNRKDINVSYELKVRALRLHVRVMSNSISVLNYSHAVYNGCVSKNLMLYKNSHQTKLTFGKWSSLLILQWQVSLDQKKVKNRNILKCIIYEF